MRKIAVALTLACLLSPGVAVHGGTRPVQSAFGPVQNMTRSPVKAKPLSPRLRAFLQAENRELEAVNDDADWPVRVSAVSLPASGKTKAIVLVYMTGRPACGTSGCYLFILERDGSSFREIGFIQGWPPIHRLPGSTNGYPHIGVWKQGGGVLPGYPARSRFTGKAYQGLNDLEQIDDLANGRIVISETTPDQLLFE